MIDLYRSRVSFKISAIETQMAEPPAIRRSPRQGHWTSGTPKEWLSIQLRPLVDVKGESEILARLNRLRRLSAVRLHSVAPGSSCAPAVTFSPATLSFTLTSHPHSPSRPTIRIRRAGWSSSLVLASHFKRRATVSMTSPSGTVTGNVSLSVDGGKVQTLPVSNGSAIFTIVSPSAVSTRSAAASALSPRSSLRRHRVHCL